jgi:hypothetical protein
VAVCRYTIALQAAVMLYNRGIIDVDAKVCRAVETVVGELPVH